MHRRQLLQAGFVAGTVGFAPRLASAEATFAPVPKGWRTFALTTKVEPTAATKAWLPLPTFAADDWQRPGATSWTGNASKVTPVTRFEERELGPAPVAARARALYWDFAHQGRWAA